MNDNKEQNQTDVSISGLLNDNWIELKKMKKETNEILLTLWDTFVTNFSEIYKRDI